MNSKIEELVLDLKSDPRFKLLKDTTFFGFSSSERNLELKSNTKFKVLKKEGLHGLLYSDGSVYWENDGRDYTEHTELESNNLKILYVKDISLGSQHGDEITIINKGENVDVLCGSSPSFKYRILRDKSIKKIYLNVDGLKDYIDKNS
ncbi:MAG: hypothetical protein NTZ83_04460 [Candidatus Pacearchaeota archaeon]|nr:hypothetical protein [Candidatus Pacearchaeota archaeon]